MVMTRAGEAVSQGQDFAFRARAGGSGAPETPTETGLCWS